MSAHPNVGYLDDLAAAMGVSMVDLRILLNQAEVPWKLVDEREAFSRRHLVEAFRASLVRWEGPVGPGPKYSMSEASERYEASLPTDGSVPF